MSKTKEEILYYRIRNLCGLLGIVLPWLSLFSAGLTTHPSPEWWYSISATYYQTPAMVGVLVPASIVLITYVSYEPIDNIVTTLSGLFGLGIVLFPCQVVWIPEGTPVGFFQLPMEASMILHTLCAMAFFSLLACNSLFLFTKHKGTMTPQKEIRNKIYRFCGWGMFIVEALFVIILLFPHPGYTTMVIEIILLHLFGISWLVKGEAFPFLNDVEAPSKQ